MVDISTQNNKINITVSSSGNTANTNITPDYAQYYSEKSKEWAISNKIVDNTDYSSKYYANESKKQADISTAKAAEVIESGNTAVSNIESARDNAIIDITNQENVSVDNVNTAGATQIANVNSAGTTQVNLAKEQVTLATNQANIATEQATIATNKTSEVVASGNDALSNIDTAKSEALTEIETLHSSSVTDITGLKNTSITDITTAKDNAITTITNQETTSKNNVIATGNEQVARIEATGNNYDNLTHKNITNCLLEVPQRISVEALANGYLSLKAGSIVSVSENGTFEDVAITEDVSNGSTGLFTPDGSRDIFIAYVPSVNELITFPINYTFSQATAPTTDVMLISLYAGWFDTTTNTMKYTYDGGTTWTICSLPFAYGNPVTTTSGTGWAGHIKQIFNGFGYVGSTVWVDKGVKYLIPNGRNEDGSLKNIEITINKIVSNTLTYGAQDYYLSLNEYGTPLFTAKNVTKYDSDKNVIIDTYANIDRLWCFAGECTADVNNKITSFSIKQPFRAIDYSDKSTISGWSMPSNKCIDLVLGASGTMYTAPANGYFYIEYDMTGNSWCVCLNDSSFGIGIYNTYSTSTAGDARAWCPVKKNDICYIYYQSIKNANLKFIYAQGDI